MTSEEDLNLLSEARELFEAFRQSHFDNDDDDGQSAMASLNHAVRKEVQEVVRTPLEDAMASAKDGAECARAIAQSVGALPATADTELRELPATLNVGQGDASVSIRTIAQTLSTAAKDPSIFFPRLLCGSIPVDPVKIGRFVGKVSTAGPVGEKSEKSEKSPDGDGYGGGSSADFVQNVARSFGGIAEPVVEGMEALGGLKEKLKSAGESLSALNSGEADVKGLADAQDKVSGLVDRFFKLFSDDKADRDGATEDVTVTVTDRGLPKQDNDNCVDSVDEGARLAKSVGELSGPLEKAVEMARNLGDTIMKIAEKLKELFNMIVESLSKLVEMVKNFIAKIPEIIDSVRQFFVPSGLTSLFLTQSEETATLLKAFDGIRESVPQPETLVATRGQLGESSGVKEAEGIVGKIKELIKKPTELIAKLAALASELPHKIISAASDAIKRWVKNHGVDAVGDKIEDGLQDIAGKIGGDRLADAVGDFLPFGSDDENDPEAQRKKEAIMGAANDLLGSFF